MAPNEPFMLPLMLALARRVQLSFRGAEEAAVVSLGFQLLVSSLAGASVLVNVVVVFSSFRSKSDMLMVVAVGVVPLRRGWWVCSRSDGGDGVNDDAAVSQDVRRVPRDRFELLCDWA